MLGRLKPFLNAYLKFGKIGTAYGGTTGAGVGFMAFAATNGDGECSKGTEECIDKLISMTATGGVIGACIGGAAFSLPLYGVYRGSKLLMEHQISSEPPTATFHTNKKR